jgi:hypothetical protein
LLILCESLRYKCSRCLIVALSELKQGPTLVKRNMKRGLFQTSSK